MTITQRIAALFVAPTGERAGGGARDAASNGGATGSSRPPTREDGQPAPAVAVLAPAADAPALAAALGLALARVHRAPAALICLWDPRAARSGWHAPPLPAAARLAKALTARGHETTAAGRLAIVRLSTACEEAAPQALRASAAAGRVPVVLALAGPRAAAFGELLALQDLVVVAVAPASDPALARLAVSGLERAVTCAVPPADPGRVLAAAGLTLLPSIRRAIAAPVAALS